MDGGEGNTGLSTDEEGTGYFQKLKVYRPGLPRTGMRRKLLRYPQAFEL